MKIGEKKDDAIEISNIIYEKINFSLYLQD